MSKSVSLVTGAAGFIGSHLSARLLAEGDEVHVFLRPTSSLARLSTVADNLVIHRLDLSDKAAVQEHVAAILPDRVFHLAAETRLSTELSCTNAREAIGLYVDPAVNLVEALAHVPDPPSVVIRAGTIAEYGRVALPYSEAGRASPLTPYGMGMLAATNCLGMLAPALPFPVITARLALCYGPRQSCQFLVPALIDAVLSQHPITVERPDDRRDLLYVSDAVTALMRIAESAPNDCTIVNVSSGMAPTMREVARRIVDLADCDPALVSMRRPLPGERPVELRCAAELARVRFGWERQVGLEEGLRQTIAAEQRMRSMAGSAR
ncbi:NAD(P)-dependent oxidoreductase [Novosphingobium sp. BL-8H]|uniref:NAD-dependent epimerase/dehydratase family protein n=1 Tax=Novosphingobium sp. BL-8H TaxID=3127640 RepID=UPI0037573E5F